MIVCYTPGSGCFMPTVKLPREAHRRFGVFDVDPDSGELRKRGKKIRLTDQSFQVLLALLERPGEVVTRQQLQQRLWPADTFVDFDASLNTAISLLREALGDSAKAPRFVETLPRRGYRFLGEVSADDVEIARTPSAPWLSRGLALVLAVLGVLVAGLSVRYFRASSQTFDSIAVLPIVYAGPQVEGDQEYLAAGITSALITELARLGVPKVISETSVTRYKGVRKPLPDIARELGADVLLEGTMVREGNTLRVNAQLIDGHTDKHIWARAYQRELHGILQLQEDMATAIAAEIRAKLVPSAQVKHSASPVVNEHAHEAYLKGRYALRSEVESRRKQAVPLFEEAITLDPTFAQAYAGLADYYSFTDALAPVEALSKARGYARKALELDNTLAGPTLVLAEADLGEWNWASAEREFAQSVELDPSDAPTRRWFSLYLELVGRPRSALAQIERLRELDPVSPDTYQVLSFHYFLARQYDAALEQVARMQEISPQDPKVFENLATMYFCKGAYAQAVAAAEQGIVLWGRDPAYLVLLAVAHARAGQRQAAKDLLTELQGIAAQRFVPPSFFAMIYMNFGEVDHAFDSLEAAFRVRDPYLAQLKVNPFFDGARDDPRFEALVRRMNFPLQKDP